jgi:hypothetical protein
MPTPRKAPGLSRIALVVLGVLVALVLLAWGALAVFLPPSRVKALVQEQASRALTREVRLDGASVGLFPPVRMTVTGLALAEPGGFESGAAFQAKALHLDLDPFALLSRRVVVRRLALDHPAVHLLLRADGTTNFDGLVKPQPPGAPSGGEAMDLDVRAFEIAGGQLLVDDLRAARRIALALDTRTSLAVEGQDRVATAGTTTLSGLATGPLSARSLSDLDTRLAKVRWTIAHRGKWDGARQRLALERLALSFGRTELGLSGVIDRPGPSARVDFRARGAKLDLREVLAMLAVAELPALKGIEGGGALDFDLAIAGTLGPGRLPAVTGALSLAGGSFRYPGAAASVKDLSFHARFAPDSLTVPDVRAVVAAQPIRASLAIARFADPDVAFAVQGDLDLAAVAPMFAPRDLRLGGRAAVDVRGRGRAKDPGGFALEGSARLAKVSVESPGIPKAIEDVNGTIAFSTASARVSGLSARAGGSSFTLDATVKRPLALTAAVGKAEPAELDFTFDSPRLDLAELLPPAQGPAVMPNARGGGRAHIGRLISQKLDVTNVNADVTLTPTALKVPAFSLTGYEGTVRGSAGFDLRDPASPGFQVDANVESVSADALLSAWTPARGLLRGTMSTKVALAGDGTRPEQLQRSLTAIGLASMVEGQLGPGPVLEAIAAATRIPALDRAKVRDFKLPFQVERGRVATREVDLRTGVGDWKVSGAVGFDGALDYAVSITVPADQVAKLGANGALAAGALTDAQGRMLIDLRVGGTAKAPKVSWDAAAMRARVAGRVSEAIAEQRAKLETDLREAARQRLQEVAQDSARKAVDALRGQSIDSLRARGKDVLKGFFGGLKPAAKPATPAPAAPAAPAPTPPPATPAPAATDSSSH